MSLNFKLDKIDDHRTVCFDGNGRLKAATQSLIWATIVLDMGEITEANAGEFYARIVVWSKLVGWFWVMWDGHDYVVTPEDIVAHIGLTTNVRTRTRHQWYARMINPLLEEDVEKVNRLLYGKQESTV